METLLRRAIALLAFASPLTADTIVVDDGGGPGVDFTDIQPAVLAAGPDDTILVLDGSYGPFVVDGKPLTVRAAGSGAQVTGTVRLRNGGPDAVMRLIGLTVVSDEKAVVVQDTPGAVSITDCELRGGHGENLPWPGDTHHAYDALELIDADAVLLLRTVAIGGSGASVTDEDYETTPTNGARGLRGLRSTLFAYECSFEGGSGGGAYDTICDSGGHGGHGAQLDGGYLYAEGCTFRGRNGGSADCDTFTGCCGDGGNGGDGLRLASLAPTAEHAGCAFFFGAGGSAGGSGASNGATGVPLRVLSGSATDVPALVQPACFGDGSGAACPCGNAGAPGAGCANSAGGGAALAASGTTSVVLDDLALHAAGATPLQTAIFIQGATLIANPFRDGVQCAGAPVVRLQAVTLDAAGAASTTIDVAAFAGLAPGDARVYQLWYRDPSGPCGTGSNLSGALLATWH